MSFNMLVALLILFWVDLFLSATSTFKNEQACVRKTGTSELQHNDFNGKKKKTPTGWPLSRKTIKFLWKPTKMYRQVWPATESALVQYVYIHVVIHMLCFYDIFVKPLDSGVPHLTSMLLGMFVISHVSTCLHKPTSHQYQRTVPLWRRMFVF